MIECTYASGHSAQNPIEHLWAPLTNWLTAVYFKAMLGGENKPPSEQNISEKDKKAKEEKIYDRAISELNTYWNGKDFDSYPITSIGVKFSESNQQ